MRKFRFQHRPGTTLVELLLFLTFFALSSGVILAFFFSTSEQRIRQQTVLIVDQSGVQVLQSMALRIRNAERIVDPPIGSTGSILTLQMASEEDNPSIFAVQSGAIVLIEHDVLQTLGSDRVVISDFVVRNTSSSADRQSVLLSFTASRFVPLTTPLSYSRPFEILVTLFPDDEANPHCACTAPVCSSGIYQWQVCDQDICSNATTLLSC